ncbi:MAG: anti-sigma factor family protein [Myxococcales bacterium]
MTCKTCVELLCDYLDGALPPDTAAELEAHLAACPPCVAFVNTYRSTTPTCRKALEAAMPEELAGRLTAFLRGKIGKG